jgi:FrmR/RcnR family transcriptional regulator, repressor of frmRAB operon
MRHSETRNGNRPANAATPDHAGPPDRARKHSVREKTKLLNRVRRIRGQVSAVEELIDADGDCEMALHTLAACRGAINALMAEILEDHIRYHVMAPGADPDSDESVAAEQLVDIVKSYLK